MKKWRRNDGAIATEYALLLVLIAIGIIFAATFLGDEIAAVFSDAATELSGT